MNDRNKLPINKNQLLGELRQLDRQGTSLWIDGDFRSPEEVTHILCVKENTSYMRDYYYEGTRLSELHFDKVDNRDRSENHKKRHNIYTNR